MYFGNVTDSIEGMEELFSDFFKDVHGFRPRSSELFPEAPQAFVDSWEQLLHEAEHMAEDPHVDDGWYNPMTHVIAEGAKILARQRGWTYKEAVAYIDVGHRYLVN